MNDIDDEELLLALREQVDDEKQSQPTNTMSNNHNVQENDDEKQSQPPNSTSNDHYDQEGDDDEMPEISISKPKSKKNIFNDDDDDDINLEQTIEPHSIVKKFNVSFKILENNIIDNYFKSNSIADDNILNKMELFLQAKEVLHLLYYNIQYPEDYLWESFFWIDQDSRKNCLLENDYIAFLSKSDELIPQNTIDAIENKHSKTINSIIELLSVESLLKTKTLLGYFEALSQQACLFPLSIQIHGCYAFCDRYIQMLQILSLLFDVDDSELDSQRPADQQYEKALYYQVLAHKWNKNERSKQLYANFIGLIYSISQFFELYKFETSNDQIIGSYVYSSLQKDPSDSETDRLAMSLLIKDLNEIQNELNQKDLKFENQQNLISQRIEIQTKIGQLNQKFKQDQFEKRVEKKQKQLELNIEKPKQKKRKLNTKESTEVAVLNRNQVVQLLKSEDLKEQQKGLIEDNVNYNINLWQSIGVYGFVRFLMVVNQSTLLNLRDEKQIEDEIFKLTSNPNVGNESFIRLDYYDQINFIFESLDFFSQYFNNSSITIVETQLKQLASARLKQINKNFNIDKIQFDKFKTQLQSDYITENVKFRIMAIICMNSENIGVNLAALWNFVIYRHFLIQLTWQKDLFEFEKKLIDLKITNSNNEMILFDIENDYFYEFVPDATSQIDKSLNKSSKALIAINKQLFNLHNKLSIRNRTTNGIDFVQRQFIKLFQDLQYKKDNSVVNQLINYPQEYEIEFNQSLYDEHAELFEDPTVDFTIKGAKLEFMQNQMSYCLYSLNALRIQYKREVVKFLALNPNTAGFNENLVTKYLEEFKDKKEERLLDLANGLNVDAFNTSRNNWLKRISTWVEKLKSYKTWIDFFKANYQTSKINDVVNDEQKFLFLSYLLPIQYANVIVAFQFVWSNFLFETLSDNDQLQYSDIAQNLFNLDIQQRGFFFTFPDLKKLAKELDKIESKFLILENNFKILIAFVIHIKNGKVRRLETLEIPKTMIAFNSIVSTDNTIDKKYYDIFTSMSKVKDIQNYFQFVIPFNDVNMTTINQENLSVFDYTIRTYNLNKVENDKFLKNLFDNEWQTIEINDLDGIFECCIQIFGEISQQTLLYKDSQQRIQGLKTQEINLRIVFTRIKDNQEKLSNIKSENANSKYWENLKGRLSQIKLDLKTLKIIINVFITSGLASENLFFKQMSKRVDSKAYAARRAIQESKEKKNQIQEETEDSTDIMLVKYNGTAADNFKLALNTANTSSMKEIDEFINGIEVVSSNPHKKLVEKLRPFDETIGFKRTELDVKEIFEPADVNLNIKVNPNVGQSDYEKDDLPVDEKDKVLLKDPEIRKTKKLLLKVGINETIKKTRNPSEPDPDLERRFINLSKMVNKLSKSKIKSEKEKAEKVSVLVVNAFQFKNGNQSKFETAIEEIEKKLNVNQTIKNKKQSKTSGAFNKHVNAENTYNERSNYEKNLGVKLNRNSNENVDILLKQIMLEDCDDDKLRCIDLSNVPQCQILFNDAEEIDQLLFEQKVLKLIFNIYDYHPKFSSLLESIHEALIRNELDIFYYAHYDDIVNYNAISHPSVKDALNSNRITELYHSASFYQHNTKIFTKFTSNIMKMIKTRFTKSKISKEQLLNAIKYNRYDSLLNDLR